MSLFVSEVFNDEESTISPFIVKQNSSFGQYGLKFSLSLAWWILTPQIVLSCVEYVLFVLPDCGWATKSNTLIAISPAGAEQRSNAKSQAKTARKCLSFKISPTSRHPASTLWSTLRCNIEEATGKTPPQVLASWKWVGNPCFVSSPLPAFSWIRNYIKTLINKKQRVTIISISTHWYAYIGTNMNIIM